MIVIIGAGPTGLYLAHRLTRDTDIIIFEKSNHIGGRAATENWHNNLIFPGAAHIMPDNELLLNLCEELNVPIHTRILEIEAEDNLIVEKGLKKLEDFETVKSDVTVLQLLKRSGLDIERFLINYGYTDMLNATVTDTIKSFGLRDFETGNKVHIADFNLLWKEMAKKLDIRLNTAAWIDSYDSGVYRVGFDDKIIEAEKVYVCTDLDSAIQITKRVANLPFIKGLHINPFAKLFVQIRRDPRISETKLKMHHKAGPFQRVIEENSELLTIYCDNQTAVDLPIHSTNYNFIEKELTRIIGRDVWVLDTKLFFWASGTHSWTNTIVSRSSEVKPNLFVLGEMNAEKQGWIEGAFEKCEEVLKNKW